MMRQGGDTVGKKEYLIIAVILLLIIVNGVIGAVNCGKDSPDSSEETLPTQTEVVPTEPEVWLNENSGNDQTVSWTGWQKAVVSAEGAAIYADREMTQPAEASVPAGEKVIICQLEGNRCRVRYGASVGWMSADVLTLEGEPTKYDTAATTVSEPQSLSGTELAKRLDKVADQHDCIGVQIAVITDGRISWTYEYGYGNRGTKAPMSPDTKLRAASVSKVMVAMGIMSMHDMEIVDIDKNVSEYWDSDIKNPNFPETPITFRNIMTHTSSLFDFGYKKRNTEALKNNLKLHTSYMNAAPGDIKCYDYNNSAICAAGAIAGNAANCNFDRYIRGYFFEPLSIDASFHAKNIRQTDLISPTYNDGTTTMTVDDLLEMSYSGGPEDDYYLYAGGLTISAKDLARMACILIGDGQYNNIYFLSEQSVEQMLTPYYTLEEYQQCLVLRYKEDLLNGENLYYHNGNLLGVYSLLCFNPDTGNGMVIISNGSDEPKLENGVYSVCGDLAQVAAELWND